jgi:hypothetical protein
MKMPERREQGKKRMNRFWCFLLGHRIEVSLWGRGNGRSWYRTVTCPRCGETIHQQWMQSDTKPLDLH